jgi:isatin hydrolase
LNGGLEVVDLTQPLGPETPVIGLPPMFAPSPGRRSRRSLTLRRAGPAWYWNTITDGRAHRHALRCAGALGDWQELPDNACDTIPARRFVGPACVIDVTGEVRADP